MNTPKLTQWLRDNSSGVYRPAREAADLIERQQVIICRLIEALPQKRDWLDPELEQAAKEIVEHMKIPSPTEHSVTMMEHNVSSDEYPMPISRNEEGWMLQNDAYGWASTFERTQPTYFNS